MQLNTDEAVLGEATLGHRQILEVLVGLLAALFTAIISSTIVSNALPTIIAELNGSQSQYTWVVTASLLAMTVTTPIWGKLSDLFNKKTLVQASIVIFVIGSIVAGLAQNLEQLIAMRVVQGIGIGGLTANVQTIIAAIIPPRERGRYAGYMGATMAVGTLSGPLLGGVIVDTPGLGWRWTFYVCVPLSVLSLVMLHKYLHVETVKRRVRIDYVGALLIAIAASLPLLWVTFAGDAFAWSSWQSAAFVGGTVVAVVAAVLVEKRHPEPMVPPRIVSQRTAALAIAGSMAVGVALFGGSVFLGQYFQVAGGHSPTVAGLLTIPLMLGSLISTTVSGRLITRHGRWKPFLVSGSLVLVAGLAAMATVDHSTPEWHSMVFMALIGLGTGALMQNYVLAVQNTVDVHEVGATSAAVAFFRSLGGAIGVSLLGAILAASVRDDVTSAMARQGIDPASVGSTSLLDTAHLPGPLAQIVREAYGDATGQIFAVSALIACVSIVASVLIKHTDLRTTVRKVPAE